MSWLPVNALSKGTKIQGTQKMPPNQVPELQINTSASKDSVNILFAAETLVANLPEKGRRATKAARSSKPKKRKASSCKEEAIPDAAHVSMSAQISLKKRKLPMAYLQNKERCKNLELGKSNNSAAKRHITNLRRDEAQEAAGLTTSVGIKSDISAHIHQTPERALTTDTILHNDRTYFDDFDDSIFDEPCLQNSISPQSSTALTVPHTESSLDQGSSQDASRTRSCTNVPPIQAHSSTANSSGSKSLRPFMHPCLLDSLDPEALDLNRRDAPTASLKHFCFRVAEVLRLSRSFFALYTTPGHSLTIESFAAIHEVRYADNYGRGQGLVLSDVFFPYKAPFITARSKTPYSATQLMLSTPAKGKSERIFVMKLRCTLAVSTARSHRSQRWHLSASQWSAEPLIEYEILDIQQASWDDIEEAKVSIEKDVRARKASIVTEAMSNVPKPLPKRDTKATKGEFSDSNKEKDPHTVLISDLDFSDFEGDLPDLTDILGS